jgi:hypothetical protein
MSILLFNKLYSSINYPELLYYKDPIESNINKYISSNKLSDSQILSLYMKLIQYIDNPEIIIPNKIKEVIDIIRNYSDFTIATKQKFIHLLYLSRKYR